MLFTLPPADFDYVDISSEHSLIGTESGIAPVNISDYDYLEGSESFSVILTFSFELSAAVNLNPNIATGNIVDNGGKYRICYLM